MLLRRLLLRRGAWIRWLLTSSARRMPRGLTRLRRSARLRPKRPPRLLRLRLRLLLLSAMLVGVAPVRTTTLLVAVAAVVAAGAVTIDPPKNLFFQEPQ